MNRRWFTFTNVPYSQYWRFTDYLETYQYRGDEDYTTSFDEGRTEVVEDCHVAYHIRMRGGMDHYIDEGTIHILQHEAEANR